MIPEADTEIWRSAPVAVELPSGEDVWGDEGIGGGFRSTWCMAGVTTRDAGEVLVLEEQLLDQASNAAQDPAGFENACRRLEGFDDDVEVDEPSQLGGLDIGVAGLVFALNALGMPTVASCRGHPGGWS